MEWVVALALFILVGGLMFIAIDSIRTGKLADKKRKEKLSR